MKPTIYIAHSTKIDYEKLIYQPSIDALADTYELILPHYQGKVPEFSLPIIQQSKAVIAFIDGISEGRAVEVGFAVALKKPTALVHNFHQPLATAAYSFFPNESVKWIEYQDNDELKQKLQDFVHSL